MTTLLPPAQFPEAIDSSMRSAFISCPKSFWYAYLQRIMPLERSIHFHAGGAFAAGCEAFRQHYWLSEPRNWRESLAVGAEALIKHWGDFEPHAKDTKTLPTMLAALAEYFSINHPETDTIKPYFVQGVDGWKPAAEINFALPIDGTAHPETGQPILYTGRFDFLGLYADTLWVVDEKTTSQMGPSWPDQWTMRAQLTGYVWAAQTYKLPVVGAIVRGIAIRSKDFGHATIPLRKQPWQIEQWYDQLVRDVQRMIRSWEEGHFDLALGDACNAYSGCAYKTLCLSQQPEAWIKTNYRHNPWNPLKTQEELEQEKLEMDTKYYSVDKPQDASLISLELKENPFG